MPEHPDRCAKESLDAYLHNGEEEEFIRCFESPQVRELYKDAEIETYIATVPFTYTYIQYCCSKGLINAGKCLIDSGADLNKTTSDDGTKNWPPLRIACFKGFADLIEAILDKTPNIHEHMILECFKIVIKNYKDFTNEKKDRSESFRLILEHIKKRDIDIRSYEDILGNTHLLYALLYANEEVAFEILQRGVYWGAKNRDVVTIEAANASVVEHHLENCVSIEKGTDDHPEKITATFNYENWISPLSRDCETDGFFHMSNVKRFKHLLNSPLVLCFLFMKWRRCRWFYYLHILLNVVNIILIGMFVVSVYNNWCLSKIILGSVSNILCLVRILYRCVLCCQYFKRKIYDFNILLNLAYSLLVLIILWVCALQDNTKKTEYKILLSLITILESFEAVLLSRVMSYHGEMFKIVFKNFCKVFLCYIVLILSFSLGYHIIFSDENSTEENIPFYRVFNLLLGNTNDELYKKINFPDKMILLFFIFIFAIVFINLLNGLAVNEIGYLIQEAELVTLKETIHYIHSTEMLYFFLGKSYKLFTGRNKILQGSINERDLTERGCFHWRESNSLTKDIILKLNELFPKRSIFSCTVTVEPGEKSKNI